MTPYMALRLAIDAVGGQRALARVLNLKSQGTVSYWLTQKRVPAERVLSIEAACKGRVTRSDLRPDIYPPALTNENQSGPRNPMTGPPPQGWH